MDRHETLKRKYAAEIASWDWPGIVADAKENRVEEDDSTRGVCYLGTVMAIYPSGKYYMFWCTNQTRHDEQRDEAFGEALEEKAAEFHGWTESGEGDPCDIYFALTLEDENANKAQDDSQAGTSADPRAEAD